MQDPFRYLDGAPEDHGLAEDALKKELSIARAQYAKSLEPDAPRDILALVYGWLTESFETPDLTAAKAPAR